MKYRIRLTALAEEHLEYWRQCGKLSVLRKIAGMFDELEEHPMTGTGKPERLKGELQGFWSRRITKADRMIYSIDGDEVLVSVVSMKGHYGDR